MTPEEWFSLCRKAAEKKTPELVAKYQTRLNQLMSAMPEDKYNTGQGCAYRGGYPTNKKTES